LERRERIAGVVKAPAPRSIADGQDGTAVVVERYPDGHSAELCRRLPHERPVVGDHEITGLRAGLIRIPEIANTTVVEDVEQPAVVDDRTAVGNRDAVVGAQPF